MYLSENLKIVGDSLLTLANKKELTQKDWSEFERYINALIYGLSVHRGDIEMKDLGGGSNHDMNNAAHSLLAHAEFIREQEYVSQAS